MSMGHRAKWPLPCVTGPEAAATIAAAAQWQQSRLRVEDHHTRPAPFRAPCLTSHPRIHVLHTHAVPPSNPPPAQAEVQRDSGGVGPGCITATWCRTTVDGRLIPPVLPFPWICLCAYPLGTSPGLAPNLPVPQAEVLRDSGGVDPRLHTDMRHCRPYQLAEERGNTGLAKVGAGVGCWGCTGVGAARWVGGSVGRCQR